MPHINPSTLTDYIDTIFRAAGAPDDHAQIVAEALVGANLAGHDSHGVIRTDAIFGRYSIWRHGSRC